MTFNQFNFMSFEELAGYLFNGVEVCVNVNKALAFRRYLSENFPDKVHNVELLSIEPCVYISLK